MAKKSPKIVLYEEGTQGREFAARVLKATDIVDADRVMQTDFVPKEDTVQVNDHGAFLAANLTAEQTRELGDAEEVIEVVDDIEIRALNEAGMLELDPEDVEWLAAEPYPELDPEQEQLSPEQLRLLCQLEQPLDADLELESQLTERMNGGGEMTEEALPDPGVTEQAARPRRTDEIPWNLRSILAPAVWPGCTGAGVRVAVLDTGIDRRHPDLRVRGGVSFVPGVRSFQDDHGHGTHVAGIIAALRNRMGIIGAAYDVELYAVKVLNRGGWGFLSWILNGLVWCSLRRVQVVNLSLGGYCPTHDPRVYDRAFEFVGRRLLRRGILPVAAAGNDWGRPVSNPARCPSYVAVSATNRTNGLAPFSSIGPQVELCAPGQGILSTYPGGYRIANGTSMACPHVTAVAALVKAFRPDWSVDQIRCNLWRSAVELGRPGKDWAFGYGLVNAFRAVNAWW